MLPGPQENQEFGTAVQHEAIGSDTGLGYILEKLTGIWRTVQEPTPERIEHLARYLLFFFEGENPALWQLLNTVTRDHLTMRHDEPGRWWVSDVCQTHGRYMSATFRPLMTSGRSSGTTRTPGGNSYSPHTLNSPLYRTTACHLRPVSALLPALQRPARLRLAAMASRPCRARPTLCVRVSA